MKGEEAGAIVCQSEKRKKEIVNIELEQVEDCFNESAPKLRNRSPKSSLNEESGLLN